MKPKLGNTGFYGAKDQAKSDRATCFIGRGSTHSSTNRYRLAWGELANKGQYTQEDVVFVSAEGNRGGRVKADLQELAKACAAYATFITDDRHNRARDYNMGEREVAQFLLKSGYKDEYGTGEWKPDWQSNHLV